jgi:hypothetical protein
MQSRHRLHPLLAVPVVVACSADPTPPSGTHPAKAAPAKTADPDTVVTDALTAPAAGDGIQLEQRFGPLGPGGETHYCQYYVLPAHAIDVQRFEHTYTAGGHHVILYPTKLAPSDVAGNLDAFDCDEVPDRGNIGFAYVGAGTRGQQEYPAGVAWHFEGSEVVMLESHMLNLGLEPLDVDYRLNLVFARSPVQDHVGTIFFYDNSIYLPELGRASAHMDCAVPNDIHVLSLAPHMHVRGVHYESSLTGGPLSAPVPLVATDDWSALEPAVYDPPLDVTAGQRIKFDCTYHNPDARAIVQGSSKTEDEMCLMIGSYYPKLDFPFEFCMSGDSGPVFEGTKTCGDAMGCFIRAQDAASTQKCAVDTCPKASKAFDEFFSCTAMNCFFAGKCTGDPTNPDCGTCPTERCADLITACANTTCE